MIFTSSVVIVERLTDKLVARAEKLNLEAGALQEKKCPVGTAKKPDPLDLLRNVQDGLNRADSTVEHVRGDYEKGEPLDEYLR